MRSHNAGKIPETAPLNAGADSLEQAAALAQASIDRWMGASDHSAQDASPGTAVPAVEAAELIDALVAWGNAQAARDAEAAAADGPPPPLRLGRFQIRGECGRGGFGVVYRAYDPLLQRDVALKIPRPEKLCDGLEPDRLVQEAQIVGRLNHPGIVKVFEARRFGPVWYIASAYCDGPDADRRWRGCRRRCWGPCCSAWRRSASCGNGRSGGLNRWTSNSRVMPSPASKCGSRCSISRGPRWSGV